MKDYLLANRVLPVDAPPLAEAFVAVEDGRIAAVGSIAELPATPPPGCRMTDLRDPAAPTLLTPGLVNTHTHLEHTFPQPVPMQDDMAQWLLDVVALSRQYASPEEKQARCRAGAREMLASGTTCVNDISSDGVSLSVLAEAGMRAVVAMEFFHPAFEPLRIEPILQAYERFRQQGSARIRPALSPHAPYNVSPMAWRAVVAACAPFLVHVHVAESRAETDWLAGEDTPLDRLHRELLGRTFAPVPPGLSPVAYLAEHGLLNDRLIVAHAVRTDTADRCLLRDFGVGISHCPRSNLMLHEETLDWTDWQGMGIAVGLGTDSRLSNRDLDLRAEARLAATLHGWSAEETLGHCTMEGARTMKLAGEIGTLEAGKAADLVLWRTTPALLRASAETAWLDEGTAAVQTWIGGNRVSDGQSA